VAFVLYDREEGPWAESGLGPTLEQLPWLRDAALAFCLEPSDNVVQVGCLGTMHATVRFTGAAAHSARPWQGRNAVHAAGALLTRLAAWAPREVLCGGFPFREVLAATTASGGRARNVIPDQFALNLNFRFAPGRSVDDAEAEVRAFVTAAGGGDCELGVEIVERAPSGRVTLDNALLRRFLALNGNAVAAKQAWTDVARLSEAGVDAVNLGPGISSQAHQAGEWTDVGLLYQSWHQFERFLTGSG
jgi:succinyl-diaminopimelate desuccinylase